MLVEALATGTHGPLQRLKLSARQEAIAALLLQGLSYKDIARRCAIAPDTVTEHVARLSAQCAAKGRRHAGGRR